MGLGAVAGICIMILLGYGFDKLRSPQSDNSLLVFLKGYPPRIVGAVCMIVALAILWGTVSRWAKFLSGLFAYAVVGGLIAVVGGGFHSSIPSLSLTRREAAVVTGLYALCALLTYRLGSGELNWPDRIAALCAPLLLTWAGTSNDRATGFKALAAMVVIFAAAAIYRFWTGHHWKKFRRRRRAESFRLANHGRGQER